MKKAITIYIDDNCEIEGFLAAIAQKKDGEKTDKSVTFMNQAPDEIPTDLYIPFQDDRKERGKAWYFKKHACCYWQDGNCILGKQDCPDSYECDSFD